MIEEILDVDVVGLLLLHLNHAPHQGRAAGECLGVCGGGERHGGKAVTSGALFTCSATGPAPETEMLVKIRFQREGKEDKSDTVEECKNINNQFLGME